MITEYCSVCKKMKVVPVCSECTEAACVAKKLSKLDKMMDRHCSETEQRNTVSEYRRQMKFQSCSDRLGPRAVRQAL